MPTLSPAESGEQEFLQCAQELYRELRQWREEHAEASLDEIAERAVPGRQQLMGLMLQQLACQHGTGEVPEGLRCEHCGQPLVYQGRRRRAVEHLEAEIKLERAYYRCPHCRQGFFPPRPQVEVDQSLLDTRDDGEGGPFSC
jgi:hypothetical protein